jgi:hypothetical protein
MQEIVPIVLIAFPFVAVFLRLVLPPGHTVLASTIAGWLFLPVATIDLPGFPNYGKPAAVGVGLLMILAFFDSARVLMLRPRLTDLFVGVWCVVPVLTAIDNDLGLKTAVAPCMDHFMALGVPYLAGRAYFADAAGVRAVALAIVIAGAIYVPLCLIEIRLSPQLHRWVYGYHYHEFAQTRRFGGWRPTVFVEHGLIVALVLGFATLIATWLWITRSARAVWGVPTPMVALTLLVTFVLCKSMGAVLLYVMGIGALLAARVTGLRWCAVALALIAPCYMVVRLSGSTGGDSIVAAAALVDEGRAASLEFRFDAERLLLAHALQRPILGWDGYGRHRLNAQGHDLAVPDGMWILAIGFYGGVGLCALFGSYLIPSLRGLTYAPVRRWNEPASAAAVGLGAMLALYAIDSVVNAPASPLFHLAIGSLAGLPRLARRQTAPVRAGAAPVRPLPRGTGGTGTPM